MLTLTGTLRQFGNVEYGKEEKKSYLKLLLEHETPGRPGELPDLRIEQLLIPSAEVGPEADSLKRGGEVSVLVRAYVRGREIAYQAVSIISGTSTAQKTKNP